ncbi:fumarate hydratase [Methanobacterium sp. ACI-7]|uniref:fumarate hydratase n=1 Tax=unclassified Methanobacterium TaxID=2627676 RepID=UPI0039C18224
MEIVNLIRDAVIEASTTFREDQFDAYKRALDIETNESASWMLELLIENAKIANKNKFPLCDDTGIPHVLVEIGEEVKIPGGFFEDITLGIEKGLQELPARPMAVRGDDIERIEQSRGLHEDPGKLIPPSFILDKTEQNGVNIHVLMLGGGPEIRASTYRVFHKRDNRKVFNEVSTWMRSEVQMLGCTPCIPAVGIGRTHFEASSLMINAMAHGNLNQQSKIEEEITESINSSKIGTLGMGGSVTALGSFVKIGPQRASGVRILSMRPCCCVEPRRSSLFLPSQNLE